jgi:hypothetical protein
MQRCELRRDKFCVVVGGEMKKNIIDDLTRRKAFSFESTASASFDASGLFITSLGAGLFDRYFGMS